MRPSTLRISVAVSGCHFARFANAVLASRSRSLLVLAWIGLAHVVCGQDITEFAVQSAGSHPSGIAPGPGGDLWFTELLADKIGQITTAGVITEFALPNAGSAPLAITKGPDGNLWFTEHDGPRIGRITPSGVITEFSVASPSYGPQGIATGPDGNLWFTERDGMIGRSTPSGVITEFPTPPVVAPSSITAGPDGALWFVDTAGREVFRMTTAGTITDRFPTPLPASHTVLIPSGIAAGPDGNIWFTGYSSSMIGRITTTGAITVWPVPTTFGTPLSIAAGPDGDLWFAEQQDQIGRITTSGVITEFPLQTYGSSPAGIATGPDGNIWFTEEAGRIGRVNLTTSPCHVDAQTLCLNDHRFAVTATWQASTESATAPATAVPLTGETGYFWFLEPGNVELVVKVLNACGGPYNNYWVFAAGLTNLGVSLTVTDAFTGASKTYSNPAGTPFQPILDTSGLRTCP
jgi:streptogramin lyase